MAGSLVDARLHDVYASSSKLTLNYILTKANEISTISSCLYVYPTGIGTRDLKNTDRYIIVVIERTRVLLNLSIEIETCHLRYRLWPDDQSLHAWSIAFSVWNFMTCSTWSNHSAHVLT